MIRRIVAVWVSLAMLFGFVVIVDVVTDITPQVEAVTITVDDSGGADYTTIQQGIAAAGPGDTVFVYSGTYHEEITINKRINLIGEDQSSTIINGTGSGDKCVVNIKEDYAYISGFTLTGSSLNRAGLSLDSVIHCKVENNTIYGNGDGIEIDYSEYCELRYNNISSNRYHGIDMDDSYNCIIANNNISANHFRGIWLFDSSNNNITENRIFSSEDSYGLCISSSENNRVSHNNISYNHFSGLLLTYDSTHNLITNNILMYNRHGGIQCGDGGYNTISDNMIISITHYYGINIGSIANTLKRNVFIDGGIIIKGDTLANWNSHDIDISNTVNGKPVYYWRNQTGGIIPSGAGQIILANCTDVLIENQEISNVTQGIGLGFSYNNTIANNKITSCEPQGLYISSYFYGIYLKSSIGNTITDNNLTDDYDGIYLSNSSENTIYKNLICSSQISMGLRDSSANNHIYHNRFVDNRQGPVDIGTNNQWDNGYPDGGNYWSSYSGSDDYYGSSQDIPGSDGIGDTPYSIYEDNQDSYPLMRWPLGEDSPPWIKIDSPLNNSVIKAGTFIYVSIDDPNLDEVYYIVNEGSKKDLHSPYNIDTSDWPDGNNLIEIHAIDLYNNTNTKSLYVILDSTPPGIELLSPLNNSVIKEGAILNISISDPHINEVEYSVNSGTPTAFSSPYEIDTSTWSDGFYSLDILAEDKAGNIGERWYIFTKDTNNPVITLNSPDNGSILNEYSNLDFDVSDANLDHVSYSLNQGPYQIFEDPYSLSTHEWADGEYMVSLKAEDTAGKVIERWYLFRKDTTSPSIESSSIDDGAVNVGIEAQIVIEFSESMNILSVEDELSIYPFIDYSCSWTNGNKTLIINWSNSLDYETLYRVLINKVAKDLADRGLEDRFDIEFTTEANSEEKPKEKDIQEEDFPTYLLILTLLVVLIIAIVIIFIVISKKKKA